MHNSTDLAVLANALDTRHRGVVPPPHETFSLSDLLAMLRRRRRLIFSVLIACVALSILAFVSATRLYKATAQIQVQKESADALGLDSVHGAADGGADAIESNITLQTEAQILQSESLALDVIKSLHLEQTADFKPKFNPIGWVIGKLSAAGGSADPADVSLEDAPGRRTHAVKIFESHLKVDAVAGTRLINVTYYSSDRKVAAQVVNALVKNLKDYNFETRHAATQEAAGWLSDQLSDLRRQSEQLQSKLVDLQHNSGIFTLGQTDQQGREQVYTPALDRLQQLTTQLQQAQSARVLKGALYEVVKNGNPEEISGLAGNATLSGASSGVTNSLTLLQQLRQQESSVQAELDEASNKFGPAYPKVTELQARLTGIRQSINEESGRLAARVKNDYVVAQDVENRDQAAYNKEKNEAEVLNGKAIDYEITRQEAQQSRDLYSSLLRRLKEADLIAGLRSSNITIVDSAMVPARPAKPNLILYVGGGLVGGIFLALCAGLYRDATDTRIQGVGDLPALASVLPIAFLPHHEGVAMRRLPQRRSNSGVVTLQLPGGGRRRMPVGFVAVDAPRAPYTEALRALRTTLLQTHDGKPAPQVLLITSSLPQEGKSMLSVNLAAVFAQSGKRVLLVDGDLRTPVLHQRLSSSGGTGISEYLAEDDASAPLPVPEPVTVGKTTLDFLSAGGAPEFPAELLASPAMTRLVREWRRSYDFILIDGAPLLPVTDSAILSQCVDYTVMVARYNQTDRSSLERSCQILRAQGIRRHGIVLNGVKDEKNLQYGYYGYVSTGKERTA